MERPFARLTVTEKAARSLRAGHPWVYAGEVLTQGDPCPDGAVVDVYSPKDRWLGAGFYNHHSKIRVRVLSRNTNDRMDEAFFARRVRYALEYRRQVMGPNFDNCRLVFGEADGFPGWTLDRFDDVLVSEVLSLGIEQRREMLYAQVRRELESMGVTVARDLRAQRVRHPAEGGHGVRQRRLFGARLGGGTVGRDRDLRKRNIL